VNRGRIVFRQSNSRRYLRTWWEETAKQRPENFLDAVYRLGKRGRLYDVQGMTVAGNLGSQSSLLCQRNRFRNNNFEGFFGTFS